MPDTRLSPADPACGHLVRFLEGQRDGLAWLEQHRPPLGTFARALVGGPKARERLRGLKPADWDQLFEVIGNEELGRTLLRHHQEEYLLFEAVKGDEKSLAVLNKERPAYARLALLIREVHERTVLAADLPDGKLTGSAAADVGCLIGEMHLERGEYHKAVEAFSRAIENQPAADVYEGRARAYRALAALDQQRARELNGG